MQTVTNILTKMSLGAACGRSVGAIISHELKQISRAPILSDITPGGQSGQVVARRIEQVTQRKPDGISQSNN